MSVKKIMIMEKQRQTTPKILLVTNHIPSNVVVKADTYSLMKCY